MVDQELTFYNSYFDKIEGISLLNGFLYDGAANSYGGRISLKRANSTVEFEVLIPGDYPFREIAFKCTDLNGYPHHNFDGTVCLNTPFVNHIYTRLGLDIEKLKGWVQKYVENEETDEHYEYMPGDCSGKIDFLFQEGEFDPNRFSQKVFGDMSFSILNAHFKEQKIERTSIICQNIGNKEITWASRYKKYEKYKGIWAYIDKEPVLARKLRIENWQDLIPLLPHDFLSFFETFRKKTGNYKLGPKTFQNKIFIALGYSIPSTSGGKEITWDLILLPADTFPKKDCTNALKLRRLDQKINWERTSNCDFQRFFGRGALSDKMKSSKVLILGVGAIGSSIAETLVRGGLKLLSINDNDTVESGNICRSVFSFTDIGCGKAAELKGRLEQISPF
ncbi:MAG TPA: ThiF family adenylyltransferase, partial [Saprospiraceae bacterium]|nr:ThiF family adenylyltransferase [Saprospiraceae bacterium]